MDFESTSLEGVKLVRLNASKDLRGTFVKVFHEPSFSEHGINAVFVEDFFSTSLRNVIRGMHFQAPPHAHAKLVTCMSGIILDIVLDIRKTAPTYGQYATFALSEEIPTALFIPPGFAHGFLVISDAATTYYKTTAVHAPEADCGIRWDSFGFKWPVENPILSGKDRNAQAFPDFISPF